jgi:hypothetical protein
MLPPKLPRVSGDPRPTCRDRAEPSATAREAYDPSSRDSGRTTLPSIEAEKYSHRSLNRTVASRGRLECHPKEPGSRIGRLTTEALSICARASGGFAAKLKHLVPMLWRLPSDPRRIAPESTTVFPKSTVARQEALFLPWQCSVGSISRQFDSPSIFR